MVSLQEKFERYDEANPHVYDLYKKFARQAIQAGHKTLSISLLTERIRWETSVVTHCEDGFKISNNHKPFYARKLNEEEEFTNKFVIKARTSL